MAGEFLKEYYAKLTKEGWIKSLLYGLLYGFTTLLLSAALFWLMGWKSVWICAIVFVLITAGVTALFFRFKFKPDKKYVAKRIDELGLEERMLTMAELEGEESFIAKRQREDALQALSTINASFIKLAISLPLITAVSISAVLGLGMTTVSALSAADVIQGGDEIINPDQEPEIKEYEVRYEIREGEGLIIGETDEGGEFQIVQEGYDAFPVIAVPDEGWMFIGWEDGPMDPYRCDTNITESVTYYAIFAEAEEGDEESDQEGDGDSEGDQSQNAPNSGDGGGQQNGNSHSPGQGAGGRYEPNNQVIDGETYYGGEVFEDAYQDAIDKVNKDGDMDDKDKDVVGGYFDGIRE